MIPCTECAHSNVCKYKETALTTDFSDHTSEPFVTKTICKLFHKKAGTISQQFQPHQR